MVLNSTMTSNWDVCGDYVVRVTERGSAGARLIVSHVHSAAQQGRLVWVCGCRDTPTQLIFSERKKYFLCSSQIRQ